MVNKHLVTNILLIIMFAIVCYQQYNIKLLNRSINAEMEKISNIEMTITSLQGTSKPQAKEDKLSGLERQIDRLRSDVGSLQNTVSSLSNRVR